MLTEEQRAQIVQELSQNLQEQKELKKALDDADCIQALYKENPQQLIDLLQYLKRLDETAVQMQ